MGKNLEREASCRGPRVATLEEYTAHPYPFPHFQSPAHIFHSESKQSQWQHSQIFPSPGDLPNPGIEARSPALQVDSLPAEPPRKPKNTGVDSLSLFWGIFPNPGIEPGSLHCRQILYHLSHQGSPRVLEWVAFPFSRGSSQPSD